MNHQITYLHCGENLRESLSTEIQEVGQVVEAIDWKEEFKVVQSGSTLLHQTAYNKKFEKEEIFQAEMREWFATNVGDGTGIEWLFERKSEDEILESVEELKDISRRVFPSGYDYDWDSSALVLNLETMALANAHVAWAIELTKLDWIERAQAAGKDSIQIPKCREGVTHGKGNVLLDDYKYDHDALTLACEFQVQASKNLYRLSLNVWREEIFECKDEWSPCYGESPIYH